MKYKLNTMNRLVEGKTSKQTENSKYLKKQKWEIC